MKLLISEEANVNVTSEYDTQTPLHHAVSKTNYEITKVLLSSTPPLTLSNSLSVKMGIYNT